MGPVFLKEYESQQDFFNLLQERTGCFIITPTNKSARSLREGQEMRLEGHEVYTVPELMHYVYKEGGGRNKIISPVQQEAILEKVVQSGEGFFSFFAGKPEQPGIFTKLRQFYSDVIRGCSKLEEMVESESLRGDLLSIYRNYLLFLKEKGLLDQDRLLLAGKRLLPRVWPDQATLIINTLHYYTPLEESILKTLGELSQETLVFSDLPGISGRELGDLANSFRNRDFGVAIAEMDRKKEYFLFFNPREEVRACAREICLLLEEGTKTEDILIVLADHDEYRPLLAEVFSEYNLPFDCLQGFPLISSPVTGLMVALINLVENPYSRPLLWRFFSSDLMHIPGLEFVRLDQLARTLNYDDLQPLFLGEVKVDKEESRGLEKLRSFLTEYVIPLGEDKEPQEFSRAIRELFSQLKLLENLLGDDPLDPARQEGLLVLNRLYEILKETEETLKILKPEEKVSFQYFQRLFLSFLKNREYYWPGHAGGIPVASLLNTRGWKGQYIFFLGAREGQFPPEVPRNFLQDKNIIRGEILKEGERDLYTMLCNCERLFITCPSLDMKGKEVKPSPIFSLLKEGTWEDRSSAMSRQDLCRELAREMNEELWQQYGTREALDILQMELARQDLSRLTSYDGILGEGQVSVPGAFSASRIQDYNRCPMYYFFKVVMGIKPRQEVKEDLEQVDFGSQVHAILERFGREKGFELLARDFRAARKFLYRIIQEFLQEEGLDLEKDLFLGCQHERWLRGLIDEKKPPGVFYSFLREEWLRAGKVNPHKFELIFGPGREEEFRLGSYPLQGRMDRLDLAEDGEMVVVYDYKTGKIPGGPDIENILDVQLPLYLLALKSSATYAKRKVCALYYGLHHRRGLVYSMIIGDRPAEVFKGKRSRSMEDLGGERAFLKLLEEVADGIRNGFFPTTGRSEEEAGCRYCDYRFICRHHSLRRREVDKSHA